MNEILVEILHKEKLVSVEVEKEVSSLDFSATELHLAELEKVGGIPTGEWSRQLDLRCEFFLEKCLIEKAESLGLTWFVRSSMVSRFPYAAKVGGYFGPKVYTDKGRTKLVRYAGDIPGDVLALMEKLDSESFTIHSLFPLPVREINLQPIDPIIVYWSSYFHIIWDKKKKICIPSSKSILGLVIAAWDERDVLTLLR